MQQRPTPAVTSESLRRSAVQPLCRSGHGPAALHGPAEIQGFQGVSQPDHHRGVGHLFPPESDRKASIPGEYRAESVNIINRIRPLSYQLLGRPEPGPKILLTWTRGRVLMNTSTQVHSNDSRPPLRIRSRQCGALCAMGAVCRRKANRTRPATSGASTPPSERPRGCRLELFFPHRMCAGCAA